MFKKKYSGISKLVEERKTVVYNAHIILKLADFFDALAVAEGSMDEVYFPLDDDSKFFVVSTVFQGNRYTGVHQVVDPTAPERNQHLRMVSGSGMNLSQEEWVAFKNHFDEIQKMIA